MKETDKDSKILTKPICYLICIFLILNIIFVTRFAFIYDVCYIPNEYKYLTGLTSEQMPLFALINRWALNPKEFYLFYYSKPFIWFDNIYMGSQDGSGFELRAQIYHNNQLTYIIWGYDILCIILYIKLRKHMKSL